MQSNCRGNILGLDWHHLWCNCPPDYSLRRNYVKGPFMNNCLICSFPLVTYVQKGRTKTEILPLRKGIPDSFAEYIFRNCRNEMRKEDLNIVDTLRKHYRLYLGQGIPEPCLIHTCRCNPEPNLKLNTNTENNCSLSPPFDKSQQNLNQNGNQRCNCCEKKYLFDCPDKAQNYLSNFKSFKVLNCTCENCHTENSTQVFKNSIHTRNFKTINTDDEEKKEKHKMKSKDSKNFKNSSTDLKCASTSYTQQEPLLQSHFRNEALQKCTCIPNKRLIFTSSKSKNLECLYNAKSYHPDSRSGSENQKGDPCLKESEVKICFCPYFKDTVSDYRTFKMKVGISTETQTDNQLIQQSQSEIQEKKNSTCKCTEKCFVCKILKQNDQILKIIKKNKHRNGSSYSFTQKSPVSPYSYSNQCVNYFHKPDESKISSSKKFMKNAEDPLFLIPSNQLIKEKKHLFKKSKSILQHKANDSNHHKDLLYENKKKSEREFPPLSFNYSKYLTDNFVKDHLQWEEIFMGKDSPDMKTCKRLGSDFTLEKPLHKKYFEKLKPNKAKPSTDRKTSDSKTSEFDYFLEINDKGSSFNKIQNGSIPFKKYKTEFKKKLDTIDSYMQVPVTTKVKNAASDEFKNLTLTKFGNENLKNKRKEGIYESKKQKLITKKKYSLPKFFKSAVKASRQLKKRKKSLKN